MTKRMLSPSSINQYLSCPRKWYYIHVLGLEEVEKFPLARGIVIHETIEHFFEWEPNFNLSYNIFLAEMRKKAFEILEQKWIEHEIPKKWGNDQFEETKDTLDKFLILHQWKMDEIFDKFQNIEKAWYWTRPKFRELYIENEELGVRGYIDSASTEFGNIILIDYKTSKITGHTVPKEYERQLYIYALLFYREQKRIPTHVIVDYLRYGRELIFPVREEDLKETEKLIKEIYASTESQDINDYPPNFEYMFCDWCDFKNMCGKE